MSSDNLTEDGAVGLARRIVDYWRSTGGYLIRSRP
jgi:hypothetical protein